jgi:hypothetical protein
LNVLHSYQLTLAPDTYQVSAGVSGEESLYLHFLDVEVSSAAPLTLRAQPAESFSGELVDVDGRPIEGATVVTGCMTLTKTDFSVLFCYGREVLTDDAGGFTVRRLAGVPFDLTVLLPGDTSGTSLPIKDVTDGGKATSVKVAIQPAPPPPPAPCPHRPPRPRAKAAVAPSV